MTKWLDRANSPRKRQSSADASSPEAISSKRVVQIMSEFFQSDRERTYEREDDDCDSLRFAFVEISSEQKTKWVADASALVGNPELMKYLRHYCGSSTPEVVIDGLSKLRTLLGLVHVWSSGADKSENAPALKLVFEGLSRGDTQTFIGGALGYETFLNII